MATIQSILEFQDKMSAVISKVANTLDNATSNMTAAKTSLEQLEYEQSEWKKTLDAANSSAVKNADNIKYAQEKYDEATNAINKTKSEIEKYEKVIQQSQSQVDKIVQEQNTFNNALNNTNNAANNASNGLNSMQGKIITLASAFQLFNQVKGFIQGINAKINEFINYTQIQMQAEDQLSIITKNRMGLMDEEVRSLYDLASAQQRIGVVGDEAVIAGMAGVAAFTTQKSSIEALTPAMNNLAVKMYGYNVNASNMEMVSKTLGRALQGDVGSLSRLGVKIDDVTKKRLMSMKEEQRAVELAKIIQGVTGDMNAEMAKTPFGRMTHATNALGDSYERLGAALLPLQATVTEVWSNIVQKIVNNLDTIVPIAATALGLIGTYFVATGTQAVIAAIKSGAAWATAFLPLTAGIGIIAAVSVALNKMGINFQQQAENILISFNWVITAIENLIIGIQNIGIAWQKAWAIIKRSGEDIQFKEFKANDYYTNQEKAQRQMNALKGGALTNRALLGTTGKGGAFDSSLITSTSGGKALKTQNQGEIEINEEDLQLLHDMATRDYMINYQQQNLTPQVNLPNVVIHETADVDSVVESLVSAVTDLAQSKLVRT